MYRKQDFKEVLNYNLNDYKIITIFGNKENYEIKDDFIPQIITKDNAYYLENDSDVNFVTVSLYYKDYNFNNDLSLDIDNGIYYGYDALVVFKFKKVNQNFKLFQYLVKWDLFSLFSFLHKFIVKLLKIYYFWVNAFKNFCNLLKIVIYLKYKISPFFKRGRGRCSNET